METSTEPEFNHKSHSLYIACGFTEEEHDQIEKLTEEIFDSLQGKLQKRSVIIEQILKLASHLPIRELVYVTYTIARTVEHINSQYKKIEE